MALNRYASALLAVGIALTPTTSFAYATKGESVMEKLGACIATRGQSKCGAEIKSACRVIMAETFNNVHSKPSLKKTWPPLAESQKNKFRKMTANLAMRQAGLGSPC